MSKSYDHDIVINIRAAEPPPRRIPVYVLEHDEVLDLHALDEHFGYGLGAFDIALHDGTIRRIYSVAEWREFCEIHNAGLEIAMTLDVDP